jgi:CBS domain-containing protein
MKVREIMTEPPLTCAPDTSLAVAARLMKEADYGTLPVVDPRGRLAGIVTDRDLCLTLAGTNRNALNILVHEAMTHDVVSARLDDDIGDTLAAMTKARVRRVPVCDDAGHLKGLLSIEDLVVRGLEAGGISAGELIAALRVMYTRVPVAVESAGADNGLMPG